LKRTFAIAIAATLCLTAACSSSPSSNRYIKAERPIEPSQPASEQPVPSAQEQEEASVTPIPEEPAEPTEITESEPSAQASEPAKNQTKSEKVQEAKKNNASVAKAVTDSIMDNGEDKVAPKDTNAERLDKAIEGIRELVKDLKQHAEKDDAAKIAEVSSLIAQNWDAMKADVIASYPDMVEFLQEKIDQLSELQTAETLDTKSVIQVDYELYQAFRQLADKAGA
jgi:outer membrane biosynthesis protein TonB